MSRAPMARVPYAVLLGVALAALGCKRPGTAGSADGGVESPTASASGSAAAVVAAATQGKNSVAQPLPPSTPMLGITAFVATVYAEPRDTAKKLGYLRVGSRIGRRSPEPVGKANCPGGWYEIFPTGYLCGDQATTDLESPILRAAARGPNLKS